MQAVTDAVRGAHEEGGEGMEDGPYHGVAYLRLVGQLCDSLV